MLKVGVLGCGRMGSFHAQTVAQSPLARLEVVFDPIPERAQQVASAWGTRAAGSLDEIDLGRLDAVVIASPSRDHAASVRACLAAGTPMFLEKPLAATLADAREVCREVERSGVFCQVGFMRRFDPAYRAAWERVRAGDVGRPTHYLAISRDPAPPSPEYVASSGGIFADLAVHDLDLLLWFQEGDPVREVYAQGCVGETAYIAEAGDVEEAQALLAFASGARATVLSSRTSLYGYDIRLEVWGTQGNLQVGYLREPAVTVLDRAGVHFSAVDGFLSRFQEAYRREIADFLERLTTGRPPAVTVREALRASELAEACRQSLQEGRPVALPG